MACEDIEKKLKSLRTQKKQVEAVLPNLQGAGLASAQENLSNINAQIAAEEKKLADCRAVSQPAAARPFIGRVKEIHCAEAGKEIGKQEPYVLVSSIDMLGQLTAGPLPVAKPSVQCFKVGPWSDIKKGSTAAASRLSSRNNPEFWDLDQRARTVANPQDVAFLASVVENDGASPDAIRGAVATALEASVVNNMGRAYQTFVDTLASAMTGAIDSFSGAGVAPGHLNFDDRMGDVRHLALTTGDLQAINSLGHCEKKLTFTRRKKSGKAADQYTVTFLFEA